jgi:YD repeat-containing protein
MVYDQNSRRIAVMDANNHIVTSVYDQRGKITAEQDPLGVFTTSQYDPAGNKTLRIDGRNWPTTYAYDKLNREITRAYIDGTRNTFTFDNAGQKTTMQDLSGVTSYVYDNDSRKLSVAYPVSAILTYSYDAVGNRLLLTDTDGLTTYVYDTQNRLTGILNPYAQRTTIAYDGLDREVVRTFANDMVLTQTFDPMGNQAVRQYWTPGGGGILMHTATYDPVGNRLTVAELNGDTQAYSYDRSYQLAYEQRVGTQPYQITYTYDGVGNRLQQNNSGALTTYAYGPANNLLKAQSPANVVTTYSFDNAGNQTLENANGALTTYIWDGENRQTLWTPSGGTATTFIYDANGLRRSANSSSGSLYNIWDNQNLLRTVNSSNATQQRFTDNPGYWGGLTSLWDLVVSVTAYYGLDMSGNTRVLTAPTGTISDQYWYTAFGQLLNSSGTTDNIHMFSGQYGGFYQSALLLYMRARVLKFMLGRWLSRDQIGLRNKNSSLFCACPAFSRGRPTGLSRMHRCGYVIS